MRHLLKNPRFLYDSRKSTGIIIPRSQVQILPLSPQTHSYFIFSNYRIKTFIFLGYLTLKNTLSQSVLYEGEFDKQTKNWLRLYVFKKYILIMTIILIYN